MSLVFVSPLIISAVLGILLAIFVSRQRLTPSSIALMALILGASLWSLGYALEFLAPTLEIKLFWAKFQYFGIAAIPLAWFAFAIRYMRTPGWLSRPLKYRALLGVIPVATFILAWTNEFHSLIWRAVHLQAVGPLQVLHFEHGPWFWIYVVYGYALILVGSVRLVGGLLGTLRLHRWQARLALFAVLITWIGNLAYITGINPIPHLDWTPFAFSIAGLLFTISLFRYQLIEILPIAERTVFAGLPDCLLVLDAQDYLVELNPAAQKMMGNPVNAPLGHPLAEVMPEMAGWVAQAGFETEYRVEIARDETPDQRYYDLRVIPLYGSYPLPVGRLVICHDITQHKQQQALLEQARARLEAAVSERTKELRQAVEQLQNELAQRALAERRFEDVVESAPDAMLLADQDGFIMLVNAQAERLFGYSRAELLGKGFEILIPPPHRDRLSSQVSQFVADPARSQTSLAMDLTTRHQDGHEIPVEISLSTLNTADGYWLACNIRDTSARLKAEQAQKQLLEEIKQSHEQLRALTFHLQEVQEFERRQIAGELHDRIGQNLTALNLNLQLVQNQLSANCNQEIQNRLVDSLKLVEETTRQVRDVMADLRPPMLDEYGLVTALRTYSNLYAQRTGISTRVLGNEFEPRLPPNVEMVLFRLVQEALHNVTKHADATQVTIQAEASAKVASVLVKDNGLGFDPRTIDAHTDEPRWGLVSMRQRAESIGAKLSINSAPGRGTMVVMRYRRRGDGD